VKDKPQEPVKSAVSINADSRVIIINEGNYGWGNASVSVFDPSSNAVVEDYYKQQNNNVALGDVCQSITKYNNQYYIVVNHSNKIIVTNNTDFQKTATINGFNSPRYLLPITYNKAYVSDLYANSIQIVDLNSNTITGSIPCSGWAEEMALIYNKAFVTNVNSNYCYVINTVTDAITDSINIGKGASSVLIDKNSKVWILSGGNTTSSQGGKLVRINPVTLQIELDLNFVSTESPNKLCINKTRDTLYYLNKGVCQFPISSIQLPANPIINQGSKLYYGLGVNPKDYSIYVSDAIDYVQKSKIEIYSTNGVFKSNFNAGIISSGFVFE
jgi:YVTN family beta-propeller protein